MRPANVHRLPLPGLARAATWVAALAVVAGYAAVALTRVLYPYELDFLESGLFIQATRHAAGLPVYLPPNADFVPLGYPPLFAWLGGQLMRLTGPIYLPLRLLSLAATLSTAALLAWVARREGAARHLALATAALFLAGNRLAGGAYEVARVDALFVFLALATTATAIYVRHTRGVLLAAVLAALATLTKQHGLIIAMVIAAYLTLAHGRRGLLFVLVYLPLVGVPATILQMTSDGWFLAHVFTLQRYSSQVEWLRAASTLVLDFGGGMGILLLTLAAAAWRETAAHRARVFLARPWLLFVALAAGLSVVSRTSVGGNLNGLVLGYAFLCLSPALLWRAVGDAPVGTSRLSRRLVAPALLLSMLLALINPLRLVGGFYVVDRLRPTPAMRAAGDRLIARLRAVDGPVLVMLHPAYAVMAGKRADVDLTALWHARRRGEEPLPPDFVTRIQSGTYALIVSDEDPYFETEPELLALLAERYAPVGRLAPDEAPPTLSGVISRPSLLLAPLPASAPP